MPKTAIFIHHGSSIGGAPNSLLETVKRIDKKQYRPIVILPEPGPLCGLLSGEGIDYRIIPLLVFYYCAPHKSVSFKNIFFTFMSLKNIIAFPFVSIANIILLAYILKKEKPSVVVINTSSLLVSGLTARLCGRRVIWHVREVISYEKSKILKKIIAGVINLSAEKVIAVSEFSRSDSLKLGLRNVSVVYNGVDLKKFSRNNPQQKKRSEFGLAAQDKVVGFIGQIYKEKGWRTLLQSAFLVSRELPGVKFLVVGTSYLGGGAGFRKKGIPNRFRDDVFFRQAVIQMRLERNFIFIGQSFEVERVIPMMNCLAFTSIVPEVFGRVMIEAMACAVPVVASDIGASCEIVQDGITGLLVKPGNPRQLAEAITRILRENKLADELGQAGYLRAREFFDIEKTVPRLLDCYGM